MPVTKTAKRALRVSRRKTLKNAHVKKAYKHAVKLARDRKTVPSLTSAFSNLDKAAKKGVIHWKRAARLKSRLAKLAHATPPVQKLESKKVNKKK